MLEPAASATTRAPAPEWPTLAGRRAVVVDATSGLGCAAARLLAARGARVALLAPQVSAVDGLAVLIRRAGGQALPIAADITDSASLQAAADAVQRSFGGTDLVFNNIDVKLPGAVGHQPWREWQRQIDHNVTGAMQLIHAFVRQLKTAAEQGGMADLVNTSSIAARHVYGQFAAYGATKACISHLTQHLRGELGRFGVRVSVIEPDLTETDSDGRLAPHDLGPACRPHSMSDRSGYLRPDDVAQVLAFIAAQPPHVSLQQVVIMPTRDGV